MDDTRRSKKRPSLPTVKNTIQIRNKTNRKPSIPTINETVPLEEPPNSHILKRKLIEVDKQIVNDSKYNKIKTDLLPKKKVAEEEKNKLDKLMNTTKDLVKDSLNPKCTNTIQQPNFNKKDLIEEICNNKEPQNVDNISLNRDISYINLDAKTVDSAFIYTNIITNLKSLNESHEEIIKNIEYVMGLQKLLLKHYVLKEKCSESTQTNNYNNQLTSFTSKTPPPPMNFISVLQCKYNLQQTEEKNLKYIKPRNLNINEYLVLNDLQCNMNNEFPEFNIPHFDCDKMVESPNLYHNKKENDLNEDLFIEETIKSISNGICCNKKTKNNMHEDKTNIENNDKLFTKSDIILSNEDIKQFLNQSNYGLELLTKNNCNNNDLHKIKIIKNNKNSKLNKISPCFPEIHESVQAELNTINKLNESLCDIEKMSCNMSIKTNEQTINDVFNDYYVPKDINLKTILNSCFNNDKLPKFSKLNALSTNMISMDKTIIEFSLQMFEQLIKDEELRAKQHQTILCLRETYLINRLKWKNTIYNLQIRNLKNRTTHEKQLQLFKQKQRSCVNKLEHSLFQIKQLGRVFDSVYNKRLTMLEEHIQYLRMQSSSKKIIRKLKTLDQVSKKEDYNTWSHKQPIDTVKNADIKVDPIKNSEFLNKNTTDKATSPINIETMIFKELENVEVQTDFELSLPSTTNKKVQTSKTFENFKSIPIDTCENESLDINTKNTSFISPIFLSNPDKLSQCFLKTSIDINSENSENSDIDIRVTNLQEKLEARKLTSEKLKKEQKKLWLDNLKAKEKYLLKEIELYDKKIEDSKKSLMVEIQKKNIQEIKSLNYSSKPILQNRINHTTILEKNNQHLNKYDNLPNEKKIPNEKNEFIHVNVIFDDTVSKIHKKRDNKTKNNCELKDQSLETNQVCDNILQLHRQTSIIEDNILEISHDVQTEVNKIGNVKKFCEKEQNNICKFNILNNKIRVNNDSSDFTSDESISEFLESPQFNKYNSNIMELLNMEQNNESSYEEERSEGDIVIEDKIYVKHYSDSDLVQNEYYTNMNVDTITNSIFNYLLKDTKEILNSKINKPILSLEKNENKYQNISCSEQAIIISDIILKHHLLPLIFKTVQMYLPKLDKMEIEKLILYLKWSSIRKKKSSEFLNYHYKTSNDDNESFEMFYQKCQVKKRCSSFKDKSRNNEVLNQNQQEAEKIERICMAKEPLLFLREIPNKPPSPYKSPTKNKLFVNIPSVSNKIHEIDIKTPSHVFNEHEYPIQNDHIIDSDSRIDYSNKIVPDTLIVEQNLPIWIKPKLKQFRVRSKIHKVLSDIIEVEEHENVNTSIVTQMDREDNKLTDLKMDKMEMQNEIVQNLLKKLIYNTITNIKKNCYPKFII